MQFSIDDLVRLNAAVINSEHPGSEAPSPDPIAMKHMITVLGQAEGFSLDDPVAVAAFLAAYISWVRPFGPTSDRTALLAAAVALDLAKVRMPRDWAGFAALLVAFREKSTGPGRRSAVLTDWLGNSTPSARQ
jgi:hypothetical protein